MSSKIVDTFEYTLDGLVRMVCERGTVDDAIRALSAIDEARKKIDRIQANPKGRAMTEERDQASDEQFWQEVDSEISYLNHERATGRMGIVDHALALNSLEERVNVRRGAVAAQYVPPITPERADREGDTQPLPTGNDRPVMHEVVIEELRKRLEVGIRRYGQPLQPFNGRDAAQDAFEEVLDLSVYLAQVRYEMAEMRAVLNDAASSIAKIAALGYINEASVSDLLARCKTIL